MRTRLILLAFMGHCASVFGEVEFDWTTVGDPGNAADTDSSGSRFFGAVDYEYRISKHEVTNEQYAEFLGNVASEDPHELFHPDMRITRTGSTGSFRYAAAVGFERHPVTHIRFFDAMRFVNWLENGQGSGGTEDGTYLIGTGVSETRAANATYFVPSENEWYKAAYYDPSLAEGEGGYWRFATQSDRFPVFEAPPGGSSSVNTWDSGIGGTTEVGAYRDSTSFYGTLDQTGNVWEWTEKTEDSNPFRRLRGASWGDNIFFRTTSIRPGDRSTGAPFIGFRVASRTTPVLGDVFRRGDSNDDSIVDLSDAVFTLSHLFMGGSVPKCLAAANANGDESLDISDGTFLLNHLFLGSPAPVAPFPDCGTSDVEADEALGCRMPPDSCL